MRRAPFDNKSNTTKQSAISTTSYGVTNLRNKDAEYRYRVSHSNVQEKKDFYLQRSVSADDVVVRSRGFKPSDRHDPIKRNFLESLTSKILHFDMETGERIPINLQKLLTPASDSHEFVQSKNKKMFASSYFYAPSHPTVEDQVELARRISHSLSDVKNMKSKGQSMYVNRKKRSVKWIHDGNGIEDEETPSTPVHTDKMSLKCLMNPCGKVLDMHGIQALGEEVNIQSVPKNPEKLFDIVRDLNNQRGRGAEIFAKRRKRSEKWVVDRESQASSIPSTPKTPTYIGKQEMNGAPKFTTLPPPTSVSNVGQPFYNPFTVDITLDSTNLPTTGRNYPCHGMPECMHTHEVKKIYLREVAVGTDADFPVEKSNVPRTEQPRRIETINDRSNNRSNNNNNFFTNASATNTDQRVNKSINRREARISINKKTKNEQQRTSTQCEQSEETDYIHVPVKQLIQEFEKTCRPVLQYKKISPKIGSMVQCPMGNDITRFFETSHSVGINKYEEEEEEVEEEEEEEEEKEDEGKYDARLREAEEFEYEGSSQTQRSLNGYISTDDMEYTSEESDSDEYEHRMIRSQSATSSSIVNGERKYSKMYQEEQSHERSSAASQELEAAYKNGESKFLNADSEVPAEAKSLLLSMITSQEDILETIKYLRNTPVLDNLLPDAAPDCKFTDVYPDGKLYEKNDQADTTGYKGPKLSNIRSMANYNTAPRGWDQSLTYYRPIKFEKQQEPIVYSDF